MKPKIVMTREQYEDEKQKWYSIGEKHGIQKICDFISIILNDPEVMGSRALSGEKINEVIDKAIALSDEYYLAFRPRHPEADVWQERLDAHQKRIFKDRADKFKVRYPWIKEIKY